MTDFSIYINRLNRPKLLVRAARHGLGDYDRRRDLRRIAGRDGVPGSQRVLETLIEQEKEIEAIRKDRCATYSIARHIELLVALIAEFKLLPERI